MDKKPSLLGRVLAVVPAKGASTRLPRKNMRLLGGLSLLERTAISAIAADVFDRIIVSTEDEEIAAAAVEVGLEAPFLRPVALSVDPAGVDDVVLHALDVLEQQGDRYQTVAVLLPTCPFRSTGDIQNAVELFRTRPEPNLMSVAEFDHTPFAALDLQEDGQVAPHFPTYFGKQSQEMPKAYRPNGAIHVLDVAWLRETRSYIARPILGFVMPRERSVDIDTQLDLTVAEAMLSDPVE